MGEPTLFEKIITGDLEADLLYEDDLCVAFRDVNPQAPIHVLIVPRTPLDRVVNAKSEHQSLLGHLLLTAARVAEQLDCREAFRLVINNGAEAGQSVFHLHVHLLAGRAFTWPPG